MNQPTPNANTCGHCGKSFPDGVAPAARCPFEYDHVHTPEPWEPKSHWDDHPNHSPDEWQYEVANGDSRQSYVDWVNSQIEQAEDDMELDTCTQCGEPDDDGEGWDGLCGSCADRHQAEQDLLEDSA